MFAWDDEGLSALCVPYGSPLARVRWVGECVAHLALKDERILVAKFFPNGRVERIYTPEQYAAVVLAQVRDPQVAAMWDVSATR